MHKAFSIFFHGLPLLTSKQGMLRTHRSCGNPPQSPAHSSFRAPPPCLVALAGHSSPHCSPLFFPEAGLFSSNFFSANLLLFFPIVPHLCSCLPKCAALAHKAQSCNTKRGLVRGSEQFHLGLPRAAHQFRKNAHCPEGHDAHRVSQSYLNKKDYF